MGQIYSQNVSVSTSIGATTTALKTVDSQLIPLSMNWVIRLLAGSVSVSNDDTTKELKVHNVRLFLRLLSANAAAGALITRVVPLVTPELLPYTFPAVVNGIDFSSPSTPSREIDSADMGMSAQITQVGVRAVAAIENTGAGAHTPTVTLDFRLEA